MESVRERILALARVMVASTETKVDDAGLVVVEWILSLIFGDGPTEEQSQAFEQLPAELQDGARAVVKGLQDGQ